MQNPVTTVADKIQQRPAESSTIAGFVALLIARLLGLTDPDTILAIAGVIAFVPTAVTWLVETWRSLKAKP